MQFYYKISKKLSLLFLNSVINLILNSLPTIQSITSGKKRNHLFIFSTMHLTLGDAVVSLSCPALGRCVL